MNSWVVIVAFAALAVVAECQIYAAYGGPTTLVGASGVTGPHGTSGPSGTVTGHGAVGPSGEHSALHGDYIAAPGILGAAAYTGIYPGYGLGRGYFF